MTPLEDVIAWAKELGCEITEDQARELRSLLDLHADKVLDAYLENLFAKKNDI